MVSGWSGTADDGAAGIAGVGKVQTRQAGELVNEEPLTKVRLMTFEPSDLSDLKIAKTLLSCQLCNVVNNVVYFLHNQPGGIGYEEIHRDACRRRT
jgi:hypothetical protein